MTTRKRILQAAMELIGQSDSLKGVTFSLESVATHVGLTKPGLMYHFPSKQALMQGLVEQAAERWDELLREQAQGAPEELDAFVRHRAYLKVATRIEVTRADYWIFTGALYHSALAETWEKKLAPWFAVEGLNARAASLLNAARFCADGAWMSEATRIFPAQDLHAVREHALQLVDGAEAAGGEA